MLQTTCRPLWSKTGTLKSIVASLALITGCTLTPPASQPFTPHRLIESDEAARAAGRPALLVPGLNTAPAAMRPLADALSTRGYRPFILQLSGYGISPELVPHRQWVSDVRQSVEALSRDTSIVIVGYSLGSIASLLAVQEVPLSRIDRLVLLAPPFELRPLSRAICMASLLPNRLCIPSRAPKEARAFDCTPVGWYEELRTMRHDLGRLDRGGLASIRTDIVVSTEDELVDADGVGRWVKERQLESWKVHLLETHSDRPGQYNHLILSREACGDACWKAIAGVFD